MSLPSESLTIASDKISAWESGKAKGCDKDLAPRASEASKSAWACVLLGSISVEELLRIVNDARPGCLAGRAIQSLGIVPGAEAPEYLQAIALYVMREHFKNKVDEPRRNKITVISLRREVIREVVSDENAKHICEWFDHTHRSLAVKEPEVRAKAIQRILEAKGFSTLLVSKAEVVLALKELRGQLRPAYAATADKITSDIL